jgi:hypothetical protein
LAQVFHDDKSYHSEAAGVVCIWGRK